MGAPPSTGLCVTAGHIPGSLPPQCACHFLCPHLLSPQGTETVMGILKLSSHGNYLPIFQMKKLRVEGP